MSVFVGWDSCGGLWQLWWARTVTIGLGKFLLGMEKFGGLVVIDGQRKMSCVGRVFGR